MPRPRSGVTIRQLRASEKRKRVWAFRDPLDPRGLVALMNAHLEYLKVKGYSERTIEGVRWSLSDFILWCQERDVMRPQDVLKPIIERYQRMLFYVRKEDGQPLTLTTQHARLSFIRQFFLWLSKNNYILSNPASGIELPKVEKRLPKHVLTSHEAELVLATADLTKPTGIRDRALLEVLYSTGVRRRELAQIKLVDLDVERGTMMVRQGKGRKDRMIPIGERAMAWVDKYVREVRPLYAVEPDDGTLFLSHWKGPLSVHNLSNLVARYVRASGVAKQGGCHLFRHAMATLMLEGGADIRFIQAMLGHVKLTTTEIYTQVSIKKLKEIHNVTHPAARLKPPGEGDGDEEGDASDDAETGENPKEGDS